MFHFDQPPPLSLYIHIPWCQRKCPYCDFNSHQATEKISQHAYIEALKRDLEWESFGVSDRQLETIFIGGGTPSLFDPDRIAELMEEIEHRFHLSDDIEITLEANPGTVEQGRLQGFQQAGINRLSLGIQSLNDKRLHAIGRIHDRKQALNAIEKAQQCGFKSINLDLMFGLPGQTLIDAADELNQLCSLQADHISYYQLTVEPNTYFYHNPPILPEDDLLWSMQKQGIELLQRHGYQRYEISAYSQVEKQCRHNINYWHFGDYLGIGAGGHGKVTNTVNNTIERIAKQRSPQSYMQLSGNDENITEHRFLSTEEAVFEFMMNNLRLMKGFTTNDFETKTGLNLAIAESNLEKAKSMNWLEQDGEHWKTTELGSQYLNDLLILFLP